MESVPNVSIVIRPKRQNDTGLTIGSPTLARHGRKEPEHVIDGIVPGPDNAP